MVVHLLTPTAHVEAEQLTLDAGSVQDHVEVVAAERSTETDREAESSLAVPFLVDVSRPDVVRVLTLPLDLDVFEPGPFPDYCLGDRVGEIAAP